MPLVRKPGSPYWYYDFRFGCKRYRGSTQTTVKAEARSIEADVLTSLQTDGHAPVSRGLRSPMLRDFLPRFEQMIARHQHLAAKTKTYYRCGANLLLNTPLKDVPLDRITTSIVAAVEFPHSAATGNNAVRTLSRALGFAAELGLLRVAPRLHQYAETPRDATFTPDYEARLLAVAPQPLADVFIVLMDTGMRPEEACRLAWIDVLWEQNLLRVPDGKTAAARRTIGMSQRVREMLVRRLREQSESKKHKDGPWVFPSERVMAGQERSHIQTVNKAFNQARIAANLPADLVLYATRHTFGTDVMERTGNQKLTMRSMGHVDVKTSARYQHPETGRIAGVIDERNAERVTQQKESAEAVEGRRAFCQTFGHSHLPVQ